MTAIGIPKIPPIPIQSTLANVYHNTWDGFSAEELLSGLQDFLARVTERMRADGDNDFLVLETGARDVLCTVYDRLGNYLCAWKDASVPDAVEARKIFHVLAALEEGCGLDYLRDTLSRLQL